MEKQLYDEMNGLWYELQRGYYLPCLLVPPEKQRPIGAWVQRMNNIWDRSREVVNNDLLYA